MRLFFKLTLLLIIAKSSLSIEGNNAFCTYHMYSKNTPLTQVACSDGVNGLITRFHYTDLRQMFPYVAAWDRASWNSPNCGSCIQVTNKANPSNRIFITAIDQCGKAPGGADAHFDISKEAFTELFGDAGIRDGHGFAVWKVVEGKKCKGNLGFESNSNEMEFLEEK